MDMKEFQNMAAIFKDIFPNLQKSTNTNLKQDRTKLFRKILKNSPFLISLNKQTHTHKQTHRKSLKLQLTPIWNFKSRIPNFRFCENISEKFESNSNFLLYMLLKYYGSVDIVKVIVE